MAVRYQPYNSLTAGGAFDVTSGGMTPASNMSTPKIMTPAPAPTSTPKTNAKTSTAKVNTPTAPTADNRVTRGGNTFIDFKPNQDAVSRARKVWEDAQAKKSAIPSISAAETTAVEAPGEEKKAAEAVLEEARMRTDGIIGMMGQYNTTPLFSEDEARQIKESVMSRLAGLGQLDEEAIRRAGEAAAAKYEPLIAEARQSAREGRGANLARAARLGQLDTTATAGIAALTGTENIGLREGRAFEGTGGVLAKFGAEYDRNISQLEAAQIQARRAAEEAERQFQLTGDEQAFEQAEGLFSLAQDAYNERNKLIEQRDLALQRALQNAQTQQEMQFDYEDRLLDQAASTLVFIDENGNPTAPDDLDMEATARQIGVPSAALGAAINEKIRDLQAVQAEQRQAVLDQMKTQAEIGATQALQEQREASALETQTMLPLDMQYRQAQIQAQQASAARSAALAQKARETPDEMSVEEGIEFLRLTGNLSNLPNDDEFRFEVAANLAQEMPQDQRQIELGLALPLLEQTQGMTIDPSTITREELEGFLNQLEQERPDVYNERVFNPAAQEYEQYQKAYGEIYPFFFGEE